MQLYATEIPNRQVEDSEPFFLTVDDIILPDEYDQDAALPIEDQFWNRPRHFTAAENTIVLGYLEAVQNGWTTAETATNDLIAFGLFPYDTLLNMYADYLRFLADGETA